MKRRGLAMGAALALIWVIGAVFLSNLSTTAAKAGDSQLAVASRSAHDVEVRPGNTLEGVLLSAGAGPVEAGRAAKALRKIFDPRDLKPGQHIVVVFESAGGKSILAGASVELAKGRFVETTRTGDIRYSARRSNTPLLVAQQDETVGAPPIDAADSDSRVVRIRRGETLARILGNQHIDRNDAHQAIEALSRRIDLRSLRIGEEVVFVRGEKRSGRYALSALGIRSRTGELIEVARRADGRFGLPGTVTTAIADAAPDAPEEVLPEPAEDETATTAAQSQEEVVTLAKGGTLHALLKARHYRGADVAAAARALALSIDPTTLRWGQKIQLSYVLGPDGTKRLDGLAIARKGFGPVVIARHSDGEFGPLTTAHYGEDAGKDDADGGHAGNAARIDEAGIDQGADSAAVYIEEQAAPRDAAYRLVVQPGDSLMNIMLREGMDAAEIDQAVRALRKVYNPRRLRQGQILALLSDVDSAGALHLAGFSIGLSERRYVDVRRLDNGNYKAAFAREPSFADRLPPEGLERLYAGYPALAVPDSHAQIEPSRTAGAEGSEGGNGDGWSVLSWLGSIGDVLGRTGSAEAAALDLAPEPKRNHALDLEERAGRTLDDPLFRRIEIGKGDTLVDTLTRGGASMTEAEAVVSAFRKVHSPRRLQIGQMLTLAFGSVEPPMPVDQGSASGDESELRLIRVSLGVTADRDIVVERDRRDRFEAREVQRPLIRTVYKATGEISSSFYESALSAGLSMDVLTQMVQVFSYDVDFQRSLQPGDSFEVLYERTETDRGDVVEQGAVLYAKLTVNGEQLAFYRYEPPDGPADYFDRNGKSVRKALLRTPIDGARISSGFGVRKHPILGYSKKHKGVDFSAPSGTPVYAAGDGVIEKIGWFSSYGKYVRVKHSNTYKTAYAHMKGYARGMKVGTRVRQGQVIGYVGSTGRSTGPHLHYEVMKHDKQVNPNGTKLPTGKQLAGTQLAQFKAEITNYQVMFAQAETITNQLARNALDNN